MVAVRAVLTPGPLTRARASRSPLARARSAVRLVPFFIQIDITAAVLIRIEVEDLRKVQADLRGVDKELGELSRAWCSDRLARRSEDDAFHRGRRREVGL